MTDAPRLRRAELAAFLRHRRANLTPGAVGLPPGTRRRARGLRREEVAALAGISTAWYTWLEQEREVRPSRATMDALAAALRLTPAEREHLLRLALPADAPAPATGCPESLVLLLDELDATPAYVVGAWWDVLGANAAALRLLHGLDTSPPQRRNLLRWLFVDPRAQALLPDWEAHVRRLLAQFRGGIATLLDHPAVNALIAELERDSEPFRRLWQQPDVVLPVPGRKRFAHPVLGLLELDYLAFQPIDLVGATLVMYRAADAETRARLRR